MRASLLSAPLALALAACGGTPPTGTRPDARIGKDPVSHVEITISNMSKSDAESFRARILETGGIEHVVMKSFNGGTAVYELDIRGCECELPAKLARVRAPGLRYEGRVSKLEYRAYDNQPPQVTFVHPEREDVRFFADSEPIILVQVKDSDVAEVTVNDIPAALYRGDGDLYFARIHLQEGANPIVVKAKDRAGNTAESRIRVMASVAPPADTMVWKTIEGTAELGSTVLVERREVAVDKKGHYRAVIPLPRGQRQIEIIEIEPSGRKAFSVKDIAW